MQFDQITATTRALPLGQTRKGFRGHVVAILPIEGDGRLTAQEMERRLIEIGFLEGAEVEVLHEGPFGKDPIAIRVGTATVALRRRDAMCIVAE